MSGHQTQKLRMMQKNKISIMRRFGSLISRAAKANSGIILSSPAPRRVAEQTRPENELDQLVSFLTQSSSSARRAIGVPETSPDPPSRHSSTDVQATFPLEMPIVIQLLPPLQNTPVSKDPVKLTKKQIVSLLGGTNYVGHFWTDLRPKSGFSKSVKGYYLVDMEIIPSHKKTRSTWSHHLFCHLTHRRYFKGAILIFERWERPVYVLRGVCRGPIFG